MLSFELFQFFCMLSIWLYVCTSWTDQFAFEFQDHQPTNQPTNQHYKKKASPWNHEEIQSASVVDQGHELSPIHRSKRTEEAPGKGEISDGN